MSLRRWRDVGATCLLLLVTACGSAATAAPAPATAPAAPSPSAQAAPPTSPASPTSSPIPSPSATPSPSSTPAATPTEARTATPTAEPSATPVEESLGTVRPVAVMVDNYVDARPHSGLAAADVVYEALAEGGITRLMPIYFNRGPGRVGPVRSTRHYFVYLAAQFGATLVHIGASPQGFAALDRTGILDVDEGRDDPGFSRDPRREAPHNAYINLPVLRDALDGRGVDLTGSTGGLRFGPAAPPAGGKLATLLEVRFPGAEHVVSTFRYAAASQTWPRSINGVPHVDAVTGEQYAARSIIVQLVPWAPIQGDDKERVDVEVIGAGDGFLALDGRVYPITWSKASASDPTRYAYADGAAVVLPRGQVWIEIASEDAGVTAR